MLEWGNVEASEGSAVEAVVAHEETILCHSHTLTSDTNRPHAAPPTAARVADVGTGRLHSWPCVHPTSHSHNGLQPICPCHIYHIESRSPHILAGGPWPHLWATRTAGRTTPASAPP